MAVVSNADSAKGFPLTDANDCNGGNTNTIDMTTDANKVKTSLNMLWTGNCKATSNPGKYYTDNTVVKFKLKSCIAGTPDVCGDWAEKNLYHQWAPAPLASTIA